MVHETEQRHIDPNDEAEFHFGHFAEQEEYKDVNRRLIRALIARLPEVIQRGLHPFLHVDVATGTGLVPQLLIEEAVNHGMHGRVIGIDPNSVSLQIARRKTPQVDRVHVEFIEGRGQELVTLLAGTIPPMGVTSISIHDAIHEIPDRPTKESVVAAMAQILSPEGLFTYNSAFTSIAMRTAWRGWAEWKTRALAALHGTRNKRVEPIEVLTPDEYKKMVSDVGLVVVHEENTEVQLSKRALWAIAQYKAFIEGVFRDMVNQAGFTLKQKRDALVNGLEAVQEDGLTRIWHEIIAQKPPLSAAA